MKKKVPILFGWLLLLLFSALQILPALHLHQQQSKSHTVVTHHTHDKHVVDYGEIHCSICNFVVHKNVDYQDKPTSIVVGYLMSSPISYIDGHCHSIFERTVHTWTNKGPPVNS